MSDAQHDRYPIRPVPKRERPILALVLRGVNAVLGRIVDALRSRR